MKHFIILLLLGVIALTISCKKPVLDDNESKFNKDILDQFNPDRTQQIYTSQDIYYIVNQPGYYQLINENGDIDLKLESTKTVNIVISKLTAEDANYGDGLITNRDLRNALVVRTIEIKEGKKKAPTIVK